MSEARPNREGILFVLSAPSGTGKSTLVKRLVLEFPDLEFSVSYTTRKSRAGECEGVDYQFVDRPAFEGLVAAGALLEWATVFGEFYGTGLERTRRELASGRDLLLDIDVQGAGQVRGSAVPSVSILALPPDYASLERRLRDRGSEDPAQRAPRLARAREEAESYPLFDYLVINDRLDVAYEDLAAIVRAERRRASRCGPEARKVVESFPTMGA